MKKVFCRIFACAFVLISSVGVSLPQNSEADFVLDKKVTLYINERSVADTLNLLSGKSDVHIGFVDTIDGNASHPKISLKIVQGTVKEVLNELVRLDNRYEWRLDGQIINVFPTKSKLKLEEILIDFLQLNEVELNDVGTTILDNVKVKFELEKLKKIKGSGVKYSGPQLENPKISMFFSNITIKDVLNEILKKKYARFWTISNYGENNEFIKITLLGYNK